MNKYWFWILFITILFLTSCKESGKENISYLIKEWLGKEVIFPNNMNFTVEGGDTVDNTLFDKPYTIMTYADTVGCIGCKLQLANWKSFIIELDSIVPDKIQYLFLLYPQKISEIQHLLRRENFDYPICIDKNDTVNKLNHFPIEIAFRTFLLDNNSKVIAIGNPIHNPKVKELYMNIIQGKVSMDKKDIIQTEVKIKEQSISLGHFNWKEEQKVVLTIQNVGKYPLVINDVATSCGCTSVDYSKQPVRPSDSISLQVTYKADKPEYFEKTITVYCNAISSPIILKITGEAK